MNCFQSLRMIRLLSQCLLALTLLVLSVFNAKAELSNNEVSKSIASKDFVMKDLAGKEHRLSDYRGKWVLINYWATWCPPCLAEMPSVNKLYEQFGSNEDVVFLLVDADGDFKKAQAYMDRKKYKMPVYTFASNLPKQLYSGSLPTTIVLDKKGRISYNGVGAANYVSPKFMTFVQALKAQKD